MKGSTKSTSSIKAKATKKRALPQDEEDTTENLPDATGKKAPKRLKSSTVVVADVEGSFSFRSFYGDNDSLLPAPTTKSDDEEDEPVVKTNGSYR